MPAPRADLSTDLSALVAHSVRMGQDLRLVQGAGGNLSVKSDGVLWIKASGTRLAEAADRQIFVPMDEAATREAVLATEDLTPFVLRDLAEPGLRPSIETALHVLLPHPAVFHVHGVGSIAAGLSASRSLTGLPGEWDVVVVPYAKPGMQLARAVLGAVPEQMRPDRPLVLLLVNHGLVVGGADPDQVAEVVDAVEAAFRPADVAPPTVLAESGTGQLCPAGTVDEVAARALCGGALTPDSAVFLGPRPFGIGRRAAAPSPGGPHSAVVAPDGSVWLCLDLGPDEREVAASLVDVARLVPTGEVTVLTADQVAELVDWEAEKWRRQLKR